MTEIERIQDDLDKGYTVTRYGNTKALHEQMLKDIKYLNDLAKNNESLHLVSGSFMSLIDRAVKLIEDDKPYTKEFLIHVWYGREEELKKHVESAENNNER